MPTRWFSSRFSRFVMALIMPGGPYNGVLVQLFVAAGQDCFGLRGCTGRRGRAPDAFLLLLVLGPFHHWRVRSAGTDSSQANQPSARDAMSLSLSHCHISFARLTGQGSGGQVLRGVFEPLGQHRRRLLEARHPRSRSCRRNRRSRRLASLGRRRRRRRCCRAGSAGARPQGAQRGAHAAGGGNGYRRGVGQRRHQRQRRARGVAQRALARHVVLERLGARWLLQHAPMVA